VPLWKLKRASWREQGRIAAGKPFKLRLLPRDLKKRPRFLPIYGRALSWTGYANERGSQHGHAAARRERHYNVEHSGHRVKRGQEPAINPSGSFSMAPEQINSAQAAQQDTFAHFDSG
jgi:hypothetical protein